MELLWLIGQQNARLFERLRVDHIAMLFVPGSVIHLGHDCLQRLSIIRVAKIETDRIHPESCVTQLSQQTDRPGRSHVQFLLDQITNRLIERNQRIAQMIFATETQQGCSACRPKPAAAKQTVEFVEVQPRQPDAIPESVFDWRYAPVLDSTFVEGAAHDS